MTVAVRSTDVAVSLEQATKRFGNVTALDNVSFTVQRGETVALLGPNGAGKTTAISLLLGLRPTTSGTVRVFGADPRAAATRARIGAMLQESGVPLTLTAREVVSFFGAMYAKPLEVIDVLGIAELTHRADARVATLSGGEKQRLYFAVALVGRPDLLFLDEPTVALDVETRRRFWTEIRGQVARGTTIVLTTHYLEEADALADRVIVVDHGRVIAEGSPADIKARVGGRYMRFYAPTLTQSDLDVLPGVQRVTHDGAYWTVLTVQPEAGLAQLFRQGAPIERLEVIDAGLEEAFLALTQRAVVQP
ncbi:MAG: ABC transporter ATP-binding protein [Gemmatimonadaceae bacterium]|nr:ABC transporter ATP-binding protein [Gemmatimonadaceae bacterium]